MKKAKSARKSETKSTTEINKKRFCAMPMVIDRGPRPGHNPQVEALILLMAKKWVNGTKLTYYFFNKTTDGENVMVNGAPKFIKWRGTKREKDAVRAGFKTWKDVGIGLTFEEVDKREDAMIRIGFMKGDGAWSYVGRDLWGKPVDERTMNFGWDITNDPDTVLHEIGHAMGFPHEHQNPFAGIVWNEANVIRDLSGPPNSWDVPTIRHNVLDKKRADEIQGSGLDQDSIMMYPLDGSWIDAPPALSNGIQPRPGLSTRDKEWAVKFYPPLSTTTITVLELFRSEMMEIEPGEQENFSFTPTRTRDYEIRTFGHMDTVMVVLEETSMGEIYLDGDDDSGSELNASINLRLIKDRKYIIRIRLYSKTGSGHTSVMVF